MQTKDRGVIWGAVLVLFGVFFLMQNFNLLGGFGDFLGVVMFGGIGLLGVGYYFRRRRHWWILFPAFVFIGIAGSSFTDMIPFLSPLSGGVFLFSLSLAFWLIFLQNQTRFWWAVIPGGILTSLAFIDVIEHFIWGNTDSLVLLGIAATFGLLWLMREKLNTDWAKWPALILLAIVALNFIPLAGKILFPAVLIIIGMSLLWRNRAGRNARSNDIMLPPRI